jgi:hypothetical protein
MMLTYPATVLLALMLPGSPPPQAGTGENPAGAVDENAIDVDAQEKADLPAESADESPERRFSRGRRGFGPPERPGRPGEFRRGRRGGFNGARRPGPGQGFERMFRQHDKNGDGKLTKDEVPPAVWERLARADADGDGAITKAEARAAMRARLRGPAVRGPRRGMGPRGGRMFRGRRGFGRRLERGGPGLWRRGPVGPRGPRFGMRRGAPAGPGPRFGAGGPGRVDGRMQRRIEQLERQVEELKKAVEALSKPADGS